VAEHNGHDTAVWSAAVVGLGFAGLPTALALHGRCPRIIGIDTSEERLGVIAAREAASFAVRYHLLEDGPPRTRP
jgi:UDP-N-acetyl-D-mannosaminuronate dehydrogenase